MLPSVELQNAPEAFGDESAARTGQFAVLALATLFSAQAILRKPLAASGAPT